MNANPQHRTETKPLEHRTPATDPRYLTKQEVAERLQLTTRSVENLVNQGRLPVIRLTSRIIRFNWEDVQAALASRRIN